MTYKITLSCERLLRSISGVAMLIALPLTTLAEEIRVLNWQGYGTDEAWSLSMFEEKTGISVVHDYFNSEQEMLTKMRTNPGTYDVVLINSAFTGVAAKEGLIQPLDMSKLSNAADLSPGMRDSDGLSYDGKTYGAAWVWGLTSFAVDTADVDPVPESIDALWDEAYAGRIGWRDDAVESVMLAAIATGQDINNPQDMDAIEEKLRALKPQIRTFWSSENEWNQFMSSNEFDIATYWSGSASRSKNQFKLPVEFVIPTEGAIGWLDGLSIATDAPQASAAYQFIDWMIDPEFYVKWDTDVGAPASANAKALGQLDATAFNRQILGDAEKVANVQFMGAMADEQREAFLALWQETKTFLQE
jgi:spermidine/putrescine transport system substrate-binding protein